MGLLTNLLFFPVTGPVAGIKWSMEQVQKVVEEELTDDAPVKQELMELQMQLELGDIDDAEYVRREAELMARLREVRAWREKFGKGTSGGPVRVSRDRDEAWARSTRSSIASPAQRSSSVKAASARQRARSRSPLRSPGADNVRS
jgi:hypothetical protein